jgi:ATP-dependent Clp protease, protease subunit
MIVRASWPPEVPGPWYPGTPRPFPPAPPLLPTAPAAFDAVTPDVRDRLLDRRRVLVSGNITDEVATRAAAELMLLDGVGDAPIDVYFSCPAAELQAANALADTIGLVGVPVRAWARGSVGGPAIAAFTAADRRLAGPFASFELRDPVTMSSGSADRLEEFAAHHRRQIETFHARIAAATGQRVDRVTGDFATGLFLDADQARRYGIVHEVERTGSAVVTPLPPST